MLDVTLFEIFYIPVNYLQMHRLYNLICCFVWMLGDIKLDEDGDNCRMRSVIIFTLDQIFGRSEQGNDKQDM